MNYSRAVMLINENIRAIETIYEPDTDKVKATRKIYKSLDKSIKTGDMVIIPTTTRHGLTVVKVVGVDVDIDFESPEKIEWIVDKVNAAESSRILEEEEKWIEQLKAAEKRRKREEIKKSMLDMYQDDGIEKLPIANMADMHVIEHKQN